jgi:hypothetical protein
MPHRESNPTNAKHPPEMAVRKDGNLALQQSQSRDDAIGAVGHLFRRFAAGASVSKEIPVWTRLADVHGESSLVVAIVPFGQIGIDFGVSAQPGQLARAYDALAGTHLNASERNALEACAKFPGFVFAHNGQGNIRAARVPARG